MALPADLKMRVLMSARETPSPTRSVARRRAAFAFAAAALASIAIFFAFGGLEHGAARPSWLIAATAASWMAVAVGASSMIGRGRSGLGRSRGALLGAVALAPAAGLAWMLLFAWLSPETSVPSPGRIGIRCFALLLALAAAPLGVILAARRGSDPTHPRALGAAIGVAIGTWAGVLVNLWCPFGDRSHVVIGHVLPLVALALAGAAIGTRVLALPKR